MSLLVPPPHHPFSSQFPPSLQRSFQISLECSLFQKAHLGLHQLHLVFSNVTLSHAFCHFLPYIPYVWVHAS